MTLLSIVLITVGCGLVTTSSRAAHWVGGGCVTLALLLFWLLR